MGDLMPFFFDGAQFASLDRIELEVRVFGIFLSVLLEVLLEVRVLGIFSFHLISSHPSIHPSIHLVIHPTSLEFATDVCTSSRPRAAYGGYLPPASSRRKNTSSYQVCSERTRQ